MARTKTDNLADKDLTELVEELRATKHEAQNLRVRKATACRAAGSCGPAGRSAPTTTMAPRMW